jgi:hypothetical protein
MKMAGKWALPRMNLSLDSQNFSFANRIEAWGNELQ